jgi:hypothetical protein
MAHTITEQELDEWLREPQWHQFAASFGQDSNKRFEVDAAGGTRVYRVTDHGETIFLGTDSTEAIRVYNGAR